MRGKLTDDQIDHVLRNQIVGRIGCYSDKQIYVVPVTYVYHNGYIYAHSQEGLKIRMMRKNPRVCFESDIIENMVNWRSVIAWGNFEELKTAAQQEAALKILIDRLLPIVNSESIKPFHPEQEPPLTVSNGKPGWLVKLRAMSSTGWPEAPWIAVQRSSVRALP